MATITHFCPTCGHKHLPDAHSKIQKRKVGGQVPFGWDYIGHGSLVPNRKEQFIIQGILIERRKGKSYPAIANLFNLRNIPTKNGAKWYPATIRKVEKARRVA